MSAARLPVATAIKSAVAAAAVVLALALTPTVGQATYTGEAQSTSIGPLAAGAGFLAVPVLYDQSDPGNIDGTPYEDATASLSVAPLSGAGRISFQTDATVSQNIMFAESPGQELELLTDTGPTLVAGASPALVAAWTSGYDFVPSALSGGSGQAAAGSGSGQGSGQTTSGAGNEEIVTASLNQAGHLVNTVQTPGAPIGDSLRLAVGPDGGYAVQWNDLGGVKAEVVAAGQSSFTPLVGPDVALAPGSYPVLAGASAAWEVDSAAGETTVAPLTIGQDTSPKVVYAAPGDTAAAFADSAGDLVLLVHSAWGWLVADVDTSGQAQTTALPSILIGKPRLAVGGSNVFVTYQAANCNAYVQELVPAAKTNAPAVDLTPQTCASPAAIAADPAGTTAFVVAGAKTGSTLDVYSAGAKASSWHGTLGKSTPALVALGSDRVLVESRQKSKNLGEQCGGAANSSSTSYEIRIFHGTSLLRQGSLQGGVMNC